MTWTSLSGDYDTRNVGGLIKLQLRDLVRLVQDMALSTFIRIMIKHASSIFITMIAQAIASLK